MQARARLSGLGLMLPLAALFAACSPGTDADAGPADAGESGCRRSVECGAGSVCEKEAGAETGICKKVFCVNDSDCGSGEICAVAKGICYNENTCDPGNPGEVCATGELCTYVDGNPQCTKPEELPGPTACRVAPSPVIVAAGASIELKAIGLDESKQLVPFVDFTFSVIGDVGSVGGDSLSATCASGVCTGTVTATSTRGSASCIADVKVYAAPESADVQVVLIDVTTGLPIANADAAVTTDAAEPTVAKTDIHGVATFPGAAASLKAVSAFPSTHQWQTIVSPDSNQVALFTVPVPDESKVAGVKGTFDFSNVTTQGDIKLGLTGMSIGGAITDLDFATLIGEIADYNIVLEGVTDADGEVVPLPSGLVLELGAESIKGDFVTLGDPGLRILWALGGRLRLSQIGSVISSVTASDEVNVGQILSAVLPFFGKFDHGVVSGLELSESNRPTSSSEGAPVPYDAWPFEELTGNDAVALNTLITQAVTYNVPTLPCVPGQGTSPSCADAKHTSGAVLLTGVVVPGIGLVPLGLTAGLDDPDERDTNDQKDGKLDYLPPEVGDAPAKGTARVDYAPPHDGLEGNLFVTIAIALDIDGLSGGSLGASTITHISDKYGATNTFPAGSFLEHQGGTWTPAAGTFALSKSGSADFYRLNLNEDEAEWNIWFPGDAGDIDVSTLRPSSVTGRAEGADIQAFKLGAGYAGAKPSDYGDLVEFNGTNMDNLVYYMGGWSSQACETVAGAHCALVE